MFCMRDLRDDKSSRSVLFLKKIIFDLLMATFSFFFEFLLLYSLLAASPRRHIWMVERSLAPSALENRNQYVGSRDRGPLGSGAPCPRQP